MPYLYAHACCSALAREALFYGSLPPFPLLDRLSAKKGVPPLTPPFDALLDAKEGPVALIQSRLSLYRWGAQGPDIWFYHWMVRPLSKVHKWGNRIHAENVNLTMEGLLDCVLAAAGEERAGRFAYFSGFLTHYALDSVGHPFVHSRCGSYRYHTMFEAELDTALLALSGTDPAKIPPAVNMPQLSAKDARVVCAMQTAIVRRWGESTAKNVLPSIVNKARKMLARQYDPKGRKRRFAVLLEKAAAGRPIISRFIFPLTADPKRDMLNLRHSEWPIPWSGEIRTADFLEILEAAALRAAGYICALFNCAYAGAPRETALQTIGQLSFDNGLPWLDSFVEEPYNASVYTQKPRR